MTISFDTEILQYMNLFNQITKLTPKDCFKSNNNLVFIVKQGDIGKAIGKKGVNVKKLSSIIKKSVKIIEFNDDVCKFIANLILPIKAKEIQREDNKVIIIANNNYEKGQIFGREKSNLKEILSTISKFFKGIEINIE